VRFLDRLWVIDSVDLVATTTWDEPAEASQLRTQYLSALSRLQPWIALQWIPDHIAITFDNPRAAADFIHREAWDQKRSVQDRLFPSHQRAPLHDLISSGLDSISAASCDLRELIDLTIGEIFLAQEDGSEGGTMSSAVGLIWLNPHTAWDPRKTGENIVHEWIHNMLFLADMVDPLFAVDYTGLSADSAHATSAILHRKRPFDRCYHSAAVAAGLVFYHAISGDPQKADALIEPTIKTVRELQDKPELMTPSGADLMQDVARFLEDRDCDHIAALLSGSARWGHPEHARS
jgi:hypothetical protein